MVNYLTYQYYVLNMLDSSKYHLVKGKDIQKYSNYTTLLFNHDPLLYTVGYNIPTIDGFKWVPIFNHDLAKIKNSMNKEFFSNYHERRINALYEVGFPLLAINRIEFYLLNSAHL